MRTRFVQILLAATAVTLGTSASAQVPVGCTPNALNISGAPFPCIYSDGRVTFRVGAPDALKIRVRVGQGFDVWFAGFELPVPEAVEDRNENGWVGADESFRREVEKEADYRALIVLAGDAL